MGRPGLGTSAGAPCATEAAGVCLCRYSIQDRLLWVLGRGRCQHCGVDLGFHRSRSVRSGDRWGASGIALAALRPKQ